MKRFAVGKMPSRLLLVCFAALLSGVLWYLAFLQPDLSPHRPLNSKTATFEDKPLHQSCSARFPQNWDADLPREWSNDETWRRQDAEKLSEVVQQELHALQNPSNCTRAVLCTFDQHCGVGCKLHHVVHCLTLAYASRRVLLMVDSGYPYQNKSWWGTHFLPLSNTCDLSHFTGVKDLEWTESTALGPHPLVRVPLASSTKWFPALYPMAVPRHLAERLFRLHCAPHVWWVGQLLAYVSRLAPEVQTRLDKLRAEIGFHKPIVGLQVRHSDKGTEAQFFPLGDYIRHLETYSRSRDGNQPPRVFLATDDAAMRQEANSSYGQYQWVTHDVGTDLASTKRYSSQSLEAAILDILLLAEADYLVCTFSSNMCRAAYELLQTKFADGSWRVTSLDQPYYLHGQRDFVRTASQDYVALSNKEVNLTTGDAMAGGQPRGRVQCEGQNLRSGQHGLYLATKVLLQTPVADFPPLRLNDSGKI